MASNLLLKLALPASTESGSAANVAASWTNTGLTSLGPVSQADMDHIDTLTTYLPGTMNKLSITPPATTGGSNPPAPVYDNLIEITTYEFAVGQIGTAFPRVSAPNANTLMLTKGYDGATGPLNLYCSKALWLPYAALYLVDNSMAGNSTISMVYYLEKVMVVSSIHVGGKTCTETLQLGFLSFGIRNNLTSKYPTQT